MLLRLVEVFGLVDNVRGILMVKSFFSFTFVLVMGFWSCPLSFADETVEKAGSNSGLEEIWRAKSAEREPVTIPSPGGAEWFFGKWRPLTNYDIEVFKYFTIVPGSIAYEFNDGEFRQEPYIVIDATDRMVLIGYPTSCDSNVWVPKGSKRCLNLEIFAVYAEKLSGWTNLYREIMLNKFCKSITTDETGLDVPVIRAIAKASFCGDVMYRGVRLIRGESPLWVFDTRRFVREDTLGFPSDPIHRLEQ